MAGRTEQGDRAGIMLLGILELRVEVFIFDKATPANDAAEPAGSSGLTPPTSGRVLNGAALLRHEDTKQRPHL